jgi:hypothetical protein
MHASVVILAVAAAYALFGCTVAGWVMFVRRASFDPDAREGSWGFRVMTFPGAVLMWPALLDAARRAKRASP